MILCKLSEILKRNGTKAIARLMIILLFLSISNISKAGWYFPFDGCDRWDMSVDNVVTSTYFQPQIEVSEDMCVGFVGYRDTKVLDLPFEAPDEECVTINPDNTYTYSNEGRCGVKNCETIISRFCARITGPEKYDNNYGCDTSDGTCSGSSKCPECKCECTTRACAFDDPAMPLDLNDDNPDKMEYHEMTNGEDLDFYMVSGFSYTDLYINQYVISNIGCVEIPLGPYPPPLCDPIQGMKPTTESADICEYSPKYEISNTSTTDDGHADNFKQKSLPGDTCELSTATGKPSEEMAYSTFEKPLVRLYFENLIELCKEDYVAPPEGTTKNDICLYLDTELTSEQIWKDKKNLLPVCSAGESTLDCIKFPSGRYDGPLGESSSFGSDYKYFRPYYNIYNYPGIDPSDTKQYAEYEEPDVSVKFGGVYDSYYEDVGDKSNVEIIDFMSYTRKFKAYLNLGDEDGEDGTKLCVDEEMDTGKDPTPVGCFDRPQMFPPVVSECLDAGSCDYGSGDTLSDEPRISFEVGRTFTDSNGDLIGPKKGIIAMDIPKDKSPSSFCVMDDNKPNGGGTANNPSPCTVYSAKVFSAYITDDNNYDINTDTDTDEDGPDNVGTNYKIGEYNGGMQYVDYVYCRGATKICLMGYQNENKKAVALMVNGRVSNNISDRIIPPSSYASPLTDDQLFNPDIHYWKAGSTSTNTEVKIGWRAQNSDGSYTYLSESTCTSGSTLCEVNIPSDPSQKVVYPTDDITCMCSNSTSKEPYECPYNSLCTWAFEETTTSTGETIQGYQYPGPGGTTYSLYDSSGKQQYGERLLNSMELGQCVEAAQPHCDAIDESNGSSTASSNGNASWEQTNAGDTAIGTCVEGLVRDLDPETGEALDPIRQCKFIDTLNTDGTAVLESNGCPVYTVGFGEVTNPCVKTPIPAWWPSEFLALNSKFQGAIFNQFNVAEPYEDIFVPRNSNYNPFDKTTLTSSSSTWVEDWYTTNTYSSCKNYGNSRDANRAPRTITDGDQEMLFLTKAQWESLWNSKDYDLTWLLENKDENNGCYVYDLKSNINATFPSSMKVGMKICKYKNKVSFSLVDLSYNSKTDYTNNAYIMQSNLIAYDQYVTRNANYPSDRDTTYIPKTQINSALLPGAKTSYHHYINHGIVVNTDGFGPSEFDEGLVIGSPPENFVTYSEPEKVTSTFLFAGQFRYEGDERYQHYTYNPDTLDDPQASCTGSGKTNYSNITKPVPPSQECALSAYRDDSIDYSQTTVTIDKYLPKPSDADYKDYYPDHEEGNSDSVNYSYISKLYRFTCYDGGYHDNVSAWPNEHDCRTEITLTYTPGNSARNESMFYWASPTNYRICNK